MSHTIEAKECRELAKADQFAQRVSKTEARRERLLSALATIVYAAQHQRRSFERHPGTCRWLSVDKDLQSWVNVKVSSCFVCYGIPGFGKSILTASAIKDLKIRLSRPRIGICYFYCDYSDVSTLNTAIIFGTLARQLLEKEKLNDIEDLLSPCCDTQARTPSLDIVFDILNKSFRILSECWVFLDGINELPHSRQVSLLGAIHVIAKLKEVTVKILVTARSEENVVRCALEGPTFHNVELCPELISGNMHIVIQDEATERIANDRLVMADAQLKNEIIEALSLGAKDM